MQRYKLDLGSQQLQQQVQTKHRDSSADSQENISASSADEARMSIETKTALNNKPLLSAGPQTLGFKNLHDSKESVHDQPNTVF